MLILSICKLNRTNIIIYVDKALKIIFFRIFKKLNENFFILKYLLFLKK